MNASFEILNKENLDVCRDLCNELMAYQKSRAKLFPEWFDSMNFDTRMRTGFSQAQEKEVVLLRVNGEPAGYVFSTIDMVPEAARHVVPAWADVKDQENTQGFFPDWLSLPQKIGCLSNLYLRKKYRGHGYGGILFKRGIKWLESFDEVDINFVYISNGNDAALHFYLANGFTASHLVFNGFITAAYRKKNNVTSI